MTSAIGPVPSDPRWVRYASTIVTFAVDPAIEADLRRPVSPELATQLDGLGLGPRFAIWTAENPEGDESAGADNAARQAALEHELEMRRVRYIGAITASADGEHRERCVAAQVPLDGAIALAREAKQIALIWFDTDHFSLVAAMIEAEPIRLPL